MPYTPTGGETIGERLVRLRNDLTRCREVIARVENNGSAFNMGGVSVTQAAYESAINRERHLQREIAALERRLTGAASPNAAIIETRMPR